VAASVEKLAFDLSLDALYTGETFSRRFALEQRHC
jgi:hypothetical protein